MFLAISQGRIPTREQHEDQDGSEGGKDDKIIETLKKTKIHSAYIFLLVCVLGGRGC